MLGSTEYLCETQHKPVQLLLNLPLQAYIFVRKCTEPYLSQLQIDAN